MKKGVLENFAKFTGKHLYKHQACNFINKETLAQMFSCEFCEIFKSTFFIEHLQTIASILWTLVGLFENKRLFSQKTLFFPGYIVRGKNRLIILETQVL